MTTSWRTPHFFRNWQFQRIFGCSLKEFAHCFVYYKPLYNGKNVILQRCQGCSSNLRSKVIGLAFAQAPQSLGFLKYDLQRPPLGINPIHLQEIELGIDCHQTVPNSVLAPFDKEQSYIDISKDYVCHDIITTPFPAIFLLLTFGKKLYQSRCSIRLTIEAIFCLAVFPNFNHSQVITLDMARTDKVNNILARKLAVSKYISKSESLTNSTLYHINCEVGLLCRVFFDTLLQGIFVTAYLGKTLLKFLGRHSIIPLFAFFTQESEIQEKFGSPINDCKEEGLETQNTFIMNMRVNHVFFLVTH